MIDTAVIIELALKSLLVAAGALAVLRLVGKRSAAQRSWIAHLGLVALIALPAAVLLMPDWNPLPAEASLATPKADLSGSMAVLPPLADAGSITSQAPPGEAVAAPGFVLPNVGELAVWAYLLPAILLLLTMLVAVLRLGAMHRRANVLVDSSWLFALARAQQRMGFKHGTALLVSKELRSPVSWGLMRPIILLNEQMIGETREAEAIIAHELAHVARLDWAKLLIARIACALFWFNPLVWRLANEAHQLREEAADDAVLLSEVDDASYAQLLVNAARHDNRALLMAAHGVAPGKDSLKRRITRVLDRDQVRTPAGGAWTALCVISLTAVAMPLAAFDPSAQTDGAEFQAGPEANSFLAGATRALPDGSLVTLTGGNKLAPVAQLASEDLDAGEVSRDARDSSRSEEIDNLVSWKAVGMTADYANEIRSAGFRNASMEDLIDAKAVGVTPEYARTIRRWDSRASLEDVVSARAVGVSPEYFGEMHAAFPDAELEEIVGARAVGVTTEFARTVRGWDRAATLEDVTSVKAIGVSSAYYGEMRSIFRDSGIEEIVQLRALGVDRAYALEMKSLFPGADAEQVAEMKAVGVTPAFVREMRNEGMSARDADEVVEARVLGGQLPGRRGKVSSSAVTVQNPDGSITNVRTDGRTTVTTANASASASAR